VSEYNDVTPLIFGRPGSGAAAEPDNAAEADSPESDAPFAPESEAVASLGGDDADADRSEAPESGLESGPTSVDAPAGEDLESELDLDADARAEFADDAVEPAIETAANSDELELEPEPSGELQLDLSSQAEDRPSTYGHPEVDAVVERLDELDYLETADHIEVFEDAHHRLHETLLAAGNELADSTDGAPPPDNA
jgi:hypothetical protein